MRTVLIASLAVLAVSACATDQASQQSAAAEAEADLGAALAGRTAGEPVSCVNMRDLEGNKGYGRNAIVFDGPTNSLVWLNRPPGGCPALSTGRALRIRTNSTRLCRGDIINVFDPVSGIEYGGCGLGDFVPYRR
jgi:hypothetical protein